MSERGLKKDGGRQRVNSIDQSAISNAELLMAYRFIADGKSRPACYHMECDFSRIKRQCLMMIIVD